TMDVFLEEIMDRSDKYKENKNPFRKKMMLVVSLVIIVVFISIYIGIGHYFSHTHTSTASRDLGEKVVITLPSGKKVYTFENLLVKENGKLLYKGERNTIDLTGGVVVYEDWKE
ncbi:MAG: hypothetical protein ABF649_20495, partial [Bacillus sp. (in: firmicutes)]